MPGINLLKRNETRSLADIRLKKNVYIASVAGFFLLILISLLVFAVSLSVSKKSEDYAVIEYAWEDKISSVSEIESLNLVLKQKLEAIKKVSDPLDYEKVFTVLDSSTPTDLNIVSLDINSDGLMSIDGDASNSTALMSFLDGLVADMGANLRSAVLTNLNLLKDGNYKFSLALEFFKNKKL